MNCLFPLNSEPLNTEHPRAALAVCAALLLALQSLANAADKQPAIGDQRTGSRAVPVHLIPLLDEAGEEILPDDQTVLPFSVRQTCAAECHSYEQINHGWHFNALEAGVSAGRTGHPWILVDEQTRTQLPLSYRRWPRTYRPQDVGLSDWRFLKRFGRHWPGGGAGQWENPQGADTAARVMVSGPLEINCLCCHDCDPAHDQTQYAVEIARENFRWAAAATSSFASVSGAAKDMPDTYDYLMPEAPDDAKLRPPQVVYRADAFDHKRRVFFHVVRRVPAQRCYYCHSTARADSATPVQEMADEDVHLSAGLTCVHCHRNGIDHRMSRGYEGEQAVSAGPSCRGCHVGDEAGGTAAKGLFGAPQPRHVGLPPIHFERLTCAACHCGERPALRTPRVRTSLAHGLGLPQTKPADAPPHIYAPVFARTPDGKIAPHYLVWPAFWGTKQKDRIRPLPLDAARQGLPEDGGGRHPAGGWAELADESVKRSLAKLAAVEGIEGAPVYVSGGQVVELDNHGRLIRSPDEAARPYLWPLAHDVRPAAQSLGAGGCADCHSRDAHFFFGKVPVDSPLAQSGSSIEMTTFEDVDRAYTIGFCFALRLRPWFKTITFLSSAVVLAILVSYSHRALVRVVAHRARAAK